MKYRVRFVEDLYRESVYIIEAATAKEASELVANGFLDLIEDYELPEPVSVQVYDGDEFGRVDSVVEYIPTYAEYVSDLLNDGKKHSADGRFSSRLVCNDGFTLSVQASVGHYCNPRSDKGPWQTVEVGFPSEEDALLLPYAERSGDQDATELIYPYTPIGVVEKVLRNHGGFSHYYVA